MKSKIIWSSRNVWKHFQSINPLFINQSFISSDWYWIFRDLKQWHGQSVIKFL